MWKWNCETLSAMQKFVVKKISRSTNITIAADEQAAPRCADSKPRAPEDLEVSSVKMCGYLKKKRNVSRGFVCVSINYPSYGSGKLRSETIHALCHDCKFPEPLRVTTHCQWPDDWPPAPISCLLSIACRWLEQIVLCAAEQPADELQLEGRVREQACVIQGCDMFDSRQHGASSFAGASLHHRLESQHVLYICEVIIAVCDLFLMTNHSP